eukprot:CAMPEP_0198734500 /NCGR_PEP_ID=MMETSP1475-20131203/53143_1 /TAXON_ID= ORGANISM="Unidentified sp., Strain CCMP1999" /NCGR_SAMPLE_ID=MMETSP1475 /ASSEMBLY_ACC=CAM_ASM_001111 /LENGTH=357 /DNA_ID=CAMNT_0044497983 /DNA_START=133 /DNA_END=1206 /DNA_ORIENTATION=-
MGTKLVDSLIRTRLIRVSPEIQEMERTYQRHYSRFLESDQRLASLMGRIRNYVTTLGTLMQSGERLAEQVLTFYKQTDRGRPVIETFCRSHRDLKKMFEDSFLKHFKQDVFEVTERKIRVDIEDVKVLHEQRMQAYQDVERLLKVIRIRTALKTRSIQLEERRLKESQDRLSLLQNEAMGRFDAVEKSLGKRLYECIQNMALIQHKFARMFNTSAEDTARSMLTNHGRATGEEPYVRETEAAVRRPAHVPIELETWDERLENNESFRPHPSIVDQRQESLSFTVREPQSINDDFDFTRSSEDITQQTNSALSTRNSGREDVSFVAHVSHSTSEQALSSQFFLTPKKSNLSSGHSGPT